MVESKIDDDYLNFEEIPTSLIVFNSKIKLVGNRRHHETKQTQRLIRPTRLRI